MNKKLTHIDRNGNARMVDVGAKAATERIAVAEATLNMQAATLKLILSGNAPKGDVLAVARVAGIQGAKRTHELIPLCHQIALTSVKVEIAAHGKAALRITATVKCSGQTGVEMEALSAAAIAGLTVYDMVKAVDRGMELTGVRLLQKSGGRSGDYRAPTTRKGTGKS